MSKEHESRVGKERSLRRRRLKRFGKSTAGLEDNRGGQFRTYSHCHEDAAVPR